MAWEQLYSEIMARPSSQACVRVCVWICVYAPTPYTSTHVGNCLLTTNLEAAKTQARSLPPSIARGKTFRLPRPGKPWTTDIQHLPVLVERVRTRDKRVRALASLAHTESLSPTQMQLERIIQLSKRYEKKEMRQMTRVDEELSSALLVCACACVHMPFEGGKRLKCFRLIPDPCHPTPSRLVGRDRTRVTRARALAKSRLTRQRGAQVKKEPSSGVQQAWKHVRQRVFKAPKVSVSERSLMTGGEASFDLFEGLG